jgi:ankyrin repeat protein
MESAIGPYQSDGLRSPRQEHSPNARGGGKVPQMSDRDIDAAHRAVIDKVQSILQFTDVPIEDINQRGMFGDTPLHVVTNWGDLHSVGVLLDAGADINAKGEDGYTPLHYATSRGHREIVKLLLERGASTDIDELMSWRQTHTS